MLSRLTSHVENEREFLESYAKLAEEAPDEYVRYLLKLVVDDEVRHHQLFQEMANTLAADIKWRRVGPTTPSPRGGDERDRARLIEAVDQFLAAERDDERQLKHLNRDMGNLHGTLFSLLLKTMEMDTRKHILILSFVKKALQHSTAA
jgi:rubrerythrin